MKKKFYKFLAVILTVILALGSTACDLISVDTDRAKEQTVVTVQAFSDAPVEKITNAQLLRLYNSYGAQYVYQGYTEEEALTEIMNSLIKDRIMVQYAIEYFFNLGLEYDGLNENYEEYTKWDVKRYLTDKEIATAEYNVKKNVNDSIESYMEQDEEEEKENYAPTVRTVPTDATNYERELSVTEMTEYQIDTGVAGNGGVDCSTERRTAYYKLLKTMESNGVVEKTFDWTTGKIDDTEYYKESLREQLQNTLLQKYDLYLAYDAVKNIDIDQLNARYKEIYESQVNTYTSYESFNSALSDATKKDAVIYNPYSNKFGYVYNLLLGINDVQGVELEEIKTKYTNNEIDKNEYYAQRSEIFKDITVKDLRDTWIESNYDFDLNNKVFLNDFTFASASSLKFQGDVVWSNQGDYQVEYVTEEKGTYTRYYTLDGTEKVYDDEYEPEFKALSKTLTYSEVMELVDDYVYGGKGTLTLNYDATRPYLERKLVATKNDVNADYDARINELIFAFSSDSGSLNTYKGYVVAENYEINYQETYVEEFAEAGRQLLELAKNGNNASYIVVETDYGYHVMFWSELMDGSLNNCLTLSDYLSAIDETVTLNDIKDAIKKGETDDYKDSYLYNLFQSVASTKSDNYVNDTKTIAYESTRNNTSKVVVKTDLINNLFGLEI